MPAAFSVSDNDIEYAERILLPAGENFDEERRRFIRNLETIDLQAVPGSGKTTALLAKLLILDRNMPLAGGAGILVLSHTNAAIDEIRGKIADHCKYLFRYPNYVGTIQSFVNEFLAGPFFAGKYGKPIASIDDDMYVRRFARPPYKIKGFTEQENKNARRFLFANRKRVNWSLSDGKCILTDGLDGKPLSFNKPKGNTKKYQDWSLEEQGKARSWVEKFKAIILREGYLCFDDAYFLANLALHRNRKIANLLRKRFPFVFVDEMQDMEHHQYSILEKIFAYEEDGASIYQRIGDINQSIYNESTQSDDSSWVTRKTVLELNGSCRLSLHNAKIVERLAVNPIAIQGKRKNPDGSSIEIKPHIVVFSEKKLQQVIPAFSEILHGLLEAGAIPSISSNLYKAVAWSTKKEPGKLRLCDYYPAYSKTAKSPKAEYVNLRSHLLAGLNRECSFYLVEKSLYTALLKVLREEDVREGGIHYTKLRLVEYLREQKAAYWEILRAKIYSWSLLLAQGKLEEVLVAFRCHLPEFLSNLGAKVNSCSGFLEDPGPDAALTGESISTSCCNIVTFGGVSIHVGSVHSVKGETHTATLYMESFFDKGGGGNHESERLADLLGGRALPKKAPEIVRKSARMAYVGFSRPTHLLCFAIHEARFAKIESKLKLEEWEVIRLP